MKLDTECIHKINLTSAETGTL